PLASCARALPTGSARVRCPSSLSPTTNRSSAACGSRASSTRPSSRGHPRAGAAVARSASGGAAPADGVLLLDKPAGITSTRALATAKRLLQAPKAGHTGTLDPFATGLLPLVFGEAAKFSRFLLEAPKTYEATLRLGEETESGDPECPVVRRSAVVATPGQIDAVLRSFLGAQQQVPPMHSALHVAGRRLYDYARAGEEVERAPRAIAIY